MIQKYMKTSAVKTHGLSDYTVSSGFDDETYSKLKMYKKMLNMQKIQSIQNMQSCSEDKAAKAGANTEGNTVQKLSRVMML